jgi:hypothetical protein
MTNHGLEEEKNKESEVPALKAVVNQKFISHSTLKGTWL